MEEKETGIELLKDFATDIVGVLKKYSEAKNDDDKVSKAEIIGMLPKAAAVGRDLLKFKELVAEAKDLTTEEGKALLDHVISLGVVGSNAEIIAINVMEIIEGEVSIWNNNVVPIIDVFKK